MREIRFRAWIKLENRMETCIAVNPFYIGDCDRFHWKHEDVELMQFTGLRDKNSKEIYEGDILSFYDINGIVKFGLHDDDVYNGWYVEISIAETHCELNKSFSVAEVIGNIFENPELLTK